MLFEGSVDELPSRRASRVFRPEGTQQIKWMTSDTFARGALIAIMFSAFKRSIVSSICVNKVQ